MKKYIFVLSFLMIACLLPVTAQRKKAVRKKAPKVEVPVENPRFTEMLASTQKVIIIDSVVVSKDALLSTVLTNREEGCIASYSQFFNIQEQPNSMVYVNELGNKCIFSMTDANGRFHLYTCDMLGTEWSVPELLQGLTEEGLTDLNYPYMMPDGQTLYFAAKGGDGLGGYDIYRTRLDMESGRFMNPENIGLPFNSEADDMLYVVSEQDSIGFFATTRQQPEGQVCIYTFIPSESRQIYDPETVDGQTLRSFARIDHIRDTWGSNVARSEALKRLEHLRTISVEQQSAKPTEEGAFAFAVNERIVYYRIQDFRDPENPNRMNELLYMKRQLSELEEALGKARNRYARLPANERQKLVDGIIRDEQQRLTLIRQISQLEKEIRNKELTN